MVKGMGGAMDLVAGVKKIVVVMEHNDKTGGAKFVHRCSLPLTGTGVVDMLITEIAVFDLPKGRLARLIELAPGVSAEEVRARTEADYEVALAPEGAISA
jgi:3-oxoacid CoA-transferase subunit B/3-oxoadipate CoA-transferase beta subunit